MGFVYVGKSSTGWKIGESNQRYLSQRVASIRKTEPDFEVTAYVKIPNSSKAMTKAVEAHARLMLERQGYKNLGLDHFVPYRAYKSFSKRAVQAMQDYCNMADIEYII